MARPKKSDHEQRKPHGVRYTDAEWDSIVSQAAQADMTPSQFIRETSFGARVTLAHGPKPADPALIVAANNISNQLSNIGNLINQMAPYAHVNGEIPTDWANEFCELPEVAKEALHTAEAALLQLVMGNER